MRYLRFGSATQLDPSGNWIDRHDLTGAGFAPRIVRLVAYADLVFLVRIEVVAENVRALLLPYIPAKLNGADRLPILDQLLVGRLEPVLVGNNAAGGVDDLG